MDIQGDSVDHLRAIRLILEVYIVKLYSTLWLNDGLRVRCVRDSFGFVENFTKAFDGDCGGLGSGLKLGETDDGPIELANQAIKGQKFAHGQATTTDQQNAAHQDSHGAEASDEGGKKAEESASAGVFPA